MKHLNRITFMVIIVGVLYYFYPESTMDYSPESVNPPKAEVFSSTIIDGVEVIDEIQIVTYEASPEPEIKTILHDVPFTSQAPFGGWDDPRQQDGCEEATILMAMKWLNGNALTQEEALEEIHAIAQFELETYGSYRDTSAEDSATRILEEYYGYEFYVVRHDIALEDIKHELMRGYIVLAPMDGQALGNPNFTPPGPEYHMLLIRGYDAETDEFITNDPGTRKGELYKYSANVLFEAIRDYPTGNHLPITGRNKSIIVVKR